MNCRRHALLKSTVQPAPGVQILGSDAKWRKHGNVEGGLLLRFFQFFVPPFTVWTPGTGYVQLSFRNKLMILSVKKATYEVETKYNCTKIQPCFFPHMDSLVLLISRIEMRTQRQKKENTKVHTKDWMKLRWLISHSVLIPRYPVNKKGFYIILYPFSEVSCQGPDETESGERAWRKFSSVGLKTCVLPLLPTQLAAPRSVRMSQPRSYTSSSVCTCTEGSEGLSPFWFSISFPEPVLLLINEEHVS